MANKIDICNLALRKLNVEPIDSLNETSKGARLCSEQYDLSRKKLLRSFYWNFATKRASLTPNGNTPAWGFSQEYDFPSDYLGLIEIKDETKDFVVEGGKILANSDTLDILYTFDQTSAKTFDDLFVELLALDIAIQLAYPLLQSLNLKQELLSEFEVILRDSRSKDTMEQRQKANVPVNDWVGMRRGGPQTFGRVNID